MTRLTKLAHAKPKLGLLDRICSKDRMAVLDHKHLTEPAVILYEQCIYCAYRMQAVQDCTLHACLCRIYSSICSWSVNIDVHVSSWVVSELLWNWKQGVSHGAAGQPNSKIYVLWKHLCAATPILTVVLSRITYKYDQVMWFWETLKVQENRCFSGLSVFVRSTGNYVLLSIRTIKNWLCSGRVATRGKWVKIFLIIYPFTLTSWLIELSSSSPPGLCIIQLLHRLHGRMYTV